ncbi:thioester domain-containing protein [Microbacterium caowuchunii]|uniref:Uncharacterized protein n=1 Tax=Microbacterium caowuchunii TaxID=2614638 RepID=A0A5N0TN98_9MICO|nr:thioester domain-containing protein [Microbacterium caowuchunii]KAA9135941.1 hypothetical protein F6B40_01830 [Microbacterium caowuchunii]
MNRSPFRAAARAPRRNPGRGLLPVLGALAAAALIVLPLGQAAQANIPDEGAPIAEPITGPNTEIYLSNTGDGQNVTGGRPATGTTQDPTAAYPDAPPAGYTGVSTFAGTIITRAVSDPSLTAEMYCINLGVQTASGVGYESGTWDESNVSNIGYVTYILNNYFPTTGAPASLGSDDERAAAVQAAIWYFTDGFVLSAGTSAVRTAAAAIVADAQTNGPVVEPPAPEVSIAPPTASAPVGAAAGPFTVTAENAAQVTVSVPAGYAMFADAGATQPIANDSAVASGTQIWVTSTSTVANETTLRARAVVTVQRGQVYLYDGNTPGRTDAQRLILADTTELDALAEATPSFFATGGLTVNKAFAGDGVGSQGAIQLSIDCGEGYVFTADIAAGADTAQEFTYSGIPVDNTCTVTEPTTGANTVVDVTTDAPQSATVTSAGASVTVTNTVTFLPGSLLVTKALSGAAAGQQGEIVIDVVCGDVLDESFVIPAGSVAGEYSQTYGDLPAGTECEISESSTGATEQVQVTPSETVTVEIEPGAEVTAAVSNEVTFAPGSLLVTKVLSGAGAGQQGDIVIDIDCGEALTDSFVIPAGTAAGEYTRASGEIPAGTECEISESSTGANQQVRVVASEAVTVAIEAGVVAEATLTNDVTVIPPVTPPRPGGTVPGALPATGAGSPTSVFLVGGAVLALGLVMVGAAYRARRGVTETGTD